MFQRAGPWHTRSVSLLSSHGRPRRTGLLPTVALLLLVLPAIGCSDDPSDAERFCGEIEADPAAVVSPSLATDEELEAALEHYRMLADLAPVAIEDEWRALVVNLETVSTVVPTDEESVQRAVGQAYATEGSAVAVQQWLLLNCSIDLGPVATIVPHDPAVPAVEWPDDPLDPASD